MPKNLKETLAKVLTIGGACQDIFIDYKNRKSLSLSSESSSELKEQKFIIFDEGEKLLVDKILYSAGGGAVNSAFSFKKLDPLKFEVTVASKIGPDHTGEFVIKELKNSNIITDNILIDKNAQTSKSFILPSKDNDYTALYSREINEGFKLEDFKGILNSKLGYDQLYITSLSNRFTKDLEKFLKLVKKKNIPVAINPGISQLVNQTYDIYNILKYVDVLILNAFEAKSYMKSLMDIDAINYQAMDSKTTYINILNNTDYKPKLLKHFLDYKNQDLNISYFFKELLKTGPEIIVVTNGKEGVYLATKGSILFHPSIKTEIASTLGAGDSFGSCFIGSLLFGAEPEKALIYGILNSTSVISHLGIKNGLLALDELEEKFKKIKYKYIQKFDY